MWIRLNLWGGEDLLTVNLPATLTAHTRLWSRKSLGFVLFIVTQYSTQTQSHMLAHTHTHSDQCLHFGLFVVQTGCYTLRPETCLNEECYAHHVAPSGPRRLTNLEVWRTNMHTPFIYNYLQIWKTQAKFTCSLLRPSLLLRTLLLLSGGPEWRLRLVDPRQLLHNLNDLVHCGFTLHAAAVIDLKLSDTKQWAPPLRQTPPAPLDEDTLWIQLFQVRW